MRRFRKGTILFPKSGASTFLNHRVMMQVDGCVSSHLATITADQSLAEPRFLLYFLATVQAQNLVQDHAYPSLNLPLIAGIKIPTPPLPEQRRIVAILDEAFEGIATAKANAEKNLQNVSELFSSHLDNIFSQDKAGWVERPLEEICERITDGEHLRPKMCGAGVPFLSAKDVRDDGVVFGESLFVSEEDAKKFRRRCNPERGDILIVSRGATVGRTCVVETDRVFCLLGSVILLKVATGIASRFVAYALKSTAARRKLMSASEASAQQAIYLRDIKPLKIKMPTLSQQVSAADALDTLSVAIDSLEDNFQRKLAALDDLKKSLLHQAFTGAL